MLRRQLVRRELGRNRSPLLAPLQVGAIAADADDDVRAGDLDRVDRPRVDLVEVLGHELMQSGVTVLALVEPRQPGNPLLVSRCDPVEVVLHPGREVVVDQATVVLFEQLRDCEREEGRDERGAPLDDVAAVENRGQDRGVRRRAPDPTLLECFDERRLGIPGGRSSLVALRLERDALDAVARLQVGEVWRMGKDAATVIKTPVDLMFGATRIAAGSYSLFLARPASDRYELVFNSQTGQWGTAHDPSKDVARVPLRRETLPNLVETFTIELKGAGKGGSFVMSWGKTRLSADFTTK